MINELTPEQKKLMYKVRDEYIKFALGGDTSVDKAAVEKGLKFLYGLIKKPMPQVVYRGSPLGCQTAANEVVHTKKKTFFDFSYESLAWASGWVAFYDFFIRAKIIETNDKFESYKSFIRAGVWESVLLEKFAFISSRPQKVLKNAEGRVHSSNSPAIEWVDGWKNYYLNGVRVKEPLVMTPAEKLDPHILLTEKNVEIRREIVRKIGIERVCQKLDAKVVDKEREYELLLLDLGDGRKRPYLKMRNPSINTYHIEGVPVEVKTVKGALEWRNQQKGSPEILT